VVVAAQMSAVRPFHLQKRSGNRCRFVGAPRRLIRSREVVGVGARRASYPNVYFEKIASARLNALSTAACAVIPFLMTSACAWPQSCSALT
jgi:hypothetical protein